MPPFELLLPFILATAGFAFLPGPGMLYMSIQTMAHGRRAGWLSAAGFHLGAYAHILAAAFGVTALLQTLPALFAVLKLAGAAYLIWMGLVLLRDGGGRARPRATQACRSTRQAFRDSLKVELLNPKTALFFFAFLPQFASPEAAAPVWLQVIVLGFCANIMFSATDVLCILSAERLALWASGARGTTRLYRRIGGGIFVGLGLHLAFRSD